MNKLYHVSGQKFHLKTDLTIDESEEVSKLLSGLYAEGTNTIAGSFTGAQLKQLLKIILEPAEPGNTTADFNFGKIKESVQMEVFKDFFTERLAKMRNTASVFAESIKQQ